MKTSVLAILCGLTICLATHAQNPSEEYTYNFSATNLPLFDLNNGSFATNVGGIDEVFTMELSPRGRISGGFSAHYDDGAVVIDLTGTLAGRLSAVAPGYRVVFGGHGPVTGTAYGRPVSGSESFRVRLDADLTTGLATGTERVTACFAGLGCRSTSEPISFDMAELIGGEGDWSLKLNLTNRNNRIGGLAQATLSTGRTVDFRVRGSYSPRLGISRIQLRGLGSAGGVLLQVTTDSAMALRSMRGKLFGQRIEIPGNSL